MVICRRLKRRVFWTRFYLPISSSICRKLEAPIPMMVGVAAKKLSLEKVVFVRHQEFGDKVQLQASRPIHFLQSHSEAGDLKYHQKSFDS